MSYSYQMVSHFDFDFFPIILFFPGMARFVSVVHVVVLSVIVSTVSLLEVFSALEATPSSHYPACLIPERSCRILQYLGSGGKDRKQVGVGVSSCVRVKIPLQLTLTQSHAQPM
jgi:hypothetical protein